MSDVVKLLPDSVANQIAAGEVIQRPASVIKELMENSVDAGATRIDVLVVDAGRTSIQVIDNGTGMSETDARLAFERHATSKISQALDIFSLTTMGFRGEALPSIVAVSQVELKTRVEGEQLGTRVCIEGSRVISQEPISCSKGCNFVVKNLFFNVPARRRFLKSNTTELNNIVSAFEKIALVYPHIAFTLHSNGNEILNLPSVGLRQRIIDISGKRFNPLLLPINVDTELVKISGFTGKPESAKKKGASQYFFVNGRYMRHPYFHRAVMMAYERLIPAGDQIPYFIYLQVNPNDIDVNIHPTKTEIKFDNEQPIWQIILAGVKEALGTYCQVPELDFIHSDEFDIPVYTPLKSSEKLTIADGLKSHITSVPNDWQTLYHLPESIPNVDMEEQQLSVFPEEPSAFSTQPPSQIDGERGLLHYQYKGQYIMTSVKSGLMIIDQHRAHVRILYEDLMKQCERNEIATQKVLFPEILELNASEILVFNRIKNDIEQLGFEICDLGNGEYSVNGIPAGLKDVDPILLFQDILASAKDNQSYNKQKIYHNLCLTIARLASIPHGQILSNEEMENIVNKLFICENSAYTPDGKAILYILPQVEIEMKLK